MKRVPYAQRRRRVRVLEAPHYYVEALEARDRGELELAFRYATKAYSAAPSSEATRALLLDLARKVGHPSTRRRG